MRGCIGNDGHRAVIGLQWGDEGKGKVIDFLAHDRGAVVRFHGGHNAGHTVVAQGNSWKLSLIPSAILHEGVLSMISSGVVVNPWYFLEEVAYLQRMGCSVNPHRLKICNRAPLILPLHETLDILSEELLGNHDIGTTRKGIGPAYADRVSRRSIRLCDLEDPHYLFSRLQTLDDYYRPFLSSFARTMLSPSELCDKLLALAPQILPYTCDFRETIAPFVSGENGFVLFEGAQGSLLDLDIGTYPFVTSSSVNPASIFSGSGFEGKLSSIWGVVKAYATRVGSGAFPTEDHSDSGRILMEKGCERGTVTGRLRRCGWFDLVSVRRAVALCGVTHLVITKLDILDHFHSVKVCTGYKVGERIYHDLPALPTMQDRIEPIYEELEGWDSMTRGLSSWKELPDAARSYVTYLSDALQLPVAIISTGPERHATIQRLYD